MKPAVSGMPARDSIITVSTAVMYVWCYLYQSGQGGELLDGLWKAFNQADQCRGLGIWRCPSLFPVFEGSGVGAQIHGEHRPGKVEL
ncbi:hypothetical protein D3C87_2011560 [compost metagenome]